MTSNMSLMMSEVDHDWEVEEIRNCHNRGKKDKNNETRLNQNPARNNLINLSVHQWSHGLEKSVSKDKCRARWRSC